MLKYMYVLYIIYMNKNVCYYKFYLNINNGLMLIVEKKIFLCVINNYVKRYVYVCILFFVFLYVEWCILVFIDIKILYIYI